ncbi:MAG TPA: hypothetical protein VJ908_11430, partial [Wenzhouxiangellaceae bacterium]|nr:hypothetical protein [Wenzhouxiangellaceae bacterium]
FDNEFHVRELYRDQFEALLARHFPNFRLYGQKLMFNSALWRLDADSAAAECLTSEVDGAVTHAAQPAPAPIYFIALAAACDVELPEPPGLSLFDDRAESVYGHYNDEVRNHIRAGHLLAERDAEIERLKAGSASDTSTSSPLWQRLRQWLSGRK